MIDADSERSSSDRALAALCYLSGIVPVYGLIFAAAVRALARKNNPWLAGHAFQASVAGAVFLGLLIVPGVGYAVSIMLAGMNAPFALFVMFLSRTLLKLVFVASWIGFSYGAYEAYSYGELPWRLGAPVDDESPR